MKIALFHQIPAPFTQQVGRALYEADLLGAFFCTLVDQPKERWQQLAKTAAGWAGMDLVRGMRRRAVTEFPLDLVRSYPIREVVRMAASKSLKSAVVDDHIFHWARDGFDRWVSRQLAGMDAVYGYEYGSLATFRRAAKLGLRRVYDLPSPEHGFVESLLAPEYERFPELASAYRRRVVEKHDERTEWRRQEWELADLVVANSTFTAKSWQAAGWSERPIAVVPYGAPPVDAEASPRKAEAGPLRAIWAGTFSVRKGAHYLIDAVRTLGANATQLRIDVYGAVTLPDAILQHVPDSCRFHGSVPRDELFVAMRQSDILVFPTLCDGFGLVVNEAFTHGLPVLTTSRAGAADLVQHGVNGYLVDAGDTTSLRDGLQRCLDERRELVEMGENAKQTAAQWQWSDYRREVANAVTQLVRQETLST